MSPRRRVVLVTVTELAEAFAQASARFSRVSRLGGRWSEARAELWRRRHAEHLQSMRLALRAMNRRDRVWAE